VAEVEWPAPVDWAAADASLQVDRTIKPVEAITPGTAAAKAKLDDFILNRLSSFHSQRNDPNVDACSGLSPYIHSGQISPQRCVLRVSEAAAKHVSLKAGSEAFIEESVVRRELSDNFCFYNPLYDSIDGATTWAQITLTEHEHDKRDYVYSEKDLEQAKTHDDLWNAAQLQMVREGKMHGFLRMYWAKKILDWSPSPREALAIAIRFNDKYELDGCDPNGYVGCMWSICGVHDQAWAERKVFGKIRFMNYAGCKRKLSIPAFVSRYRSSVHGDGLPKKPKV
jgi:deoxyribodipyrimidine photo-lyase